ncbi:MAG: hypothetical protein ACOVOG_17940, partial [Rubrivivax sp.]
VAAHGAGVCLWDPSSSTAPPAVQMADRGWATLLRWLPAGAPASVSVPCASLDVSIAGSGDVRYVGNPVVKRSVVGSGTVQPLH